ncbi:MAG: type II toxin-antitoxin system Phd/YefM family antitoxin [Roseofilum sp. SBFL]|uniref:type II toxin-antitoxin system Phd/YefM family antitoxin n=1 Tax=unclassified Roseofilum TaxID=2620099 RepID=UPI001AFF7D9A|nr:MULTISPECIES: type II toxin-antitoxin system Phd/YefM family antitoxin [unclassified Roseofilum]MBP0012285.1 type II toxin-antitoxin system Phd/YefM family antitoxin [Roseofilum sp. SID3]MBP0024106.1 type II toxin-antitoxin system Phd/YefM family antitoxin [Roseofilum sp. SID2]MBP0039592.1 type II toxin-antitoxin system Phd/YefM family antitoxin [Roseofilum sp. SID1]MBP0042978.1 type II toxin-antitoxin system Phd/YefM family antitoxin [Roseofilum sp. SBFL]
METISENQYADIIDELVGRANENNQPILLQGAAGNAIVISEKEWNALQETLYLQSIPGMSESIKEGRQTLIEDCVDESTIRDILNG